MFRDVYSFDGGYTGIKEAYVISRVYGLSNQKLHTVYRTQPINKSCCKGTIMSERWLEQV